MKHFLLLITIFIYTTSFSQKIITKSYDSKKLNKERTLKIFLPKNYTKDTISSYPLTIVLGDEYLFDLYVGSSKLFADADMAPRQIVVGIDMKKTYNKDTSIVPANKALTSTASSFYDFIKEEVIPYMETSYKVSPFLTIVGEGKAANFLTYYLKEVTPVFNAYVCIAPAFSESTVNIINSYGLKRLNAIDNTFFIYSNTSKHTSRKQHNFFNEVKALISSYDAKNIRVIFESFNDSPNLLSSIGEAVPRAISQIFKLYAKISKEEFNKHIKDLPPLDAIKYVEKKYLDIEYLYGTNLNVRLDDIYIIEEIVMDRQDGDYLRVLGDFALIKYPDLHLGDFYIGKYHELGKDYEKADFYYKAAYGKMELSDPNADAFYENIKRVNRLMNSAPEEHLNLQEEENLEEQEEEQQEDEQQEDHEEQKEGE
ncbi:hypothetical protein [Tenacibaculum maritimum]|uniref:hypothetical protein n=1 Tax=Tenacibaculum maritimum TaxID=107401 RepID=UPI0038771072